MGKGMERYAAGIDVGGTTVKMGLFSDDGLLEKWEIPTRKKDGGKQVLPDIAESLSGHLAARKMTFGDLKGAGIDVPGAVLEDGTVNRCVNIGWGVFQLRDTFSGMIGGIPVEAVNDANAAALGEQWKGSGSGYHNIVMVTLGTGVGGGVVVNDRIVTGAFGAAGEIGHLQMREDETETCGCGKRGCLEQYASAHGIARVTKKYLKEHPKEATSLRFRDHISARVLFDEAKKGDKVSLKIVEEVCRCLGRGLSFVSAVIDPEMFVIGGGVSNAGPILTDTIQKYYREYAFHASRKTKFRLASLGNDAGMYGSARLILG